MDEFAALDATASAELVKKKEVRPIELVEAAIARIEALNPKLNAVVRPMYEEARKTASTEIPAGPFAGVPFLLKDILATWAGVPMTCGCRALKDYVPHEDSELVTRLKRAGLIVLGKTNTPEFGILPTTEPLLFGPTCNPWNVEYTAGGSSGGSAAAVAAGFVPMAHANDGGGSIRIPASCCGLFGLKPTRARNPLGPNVAEIMGGFVAEHAVTRSVRDSARLLDATQGPDIGDPYWAPPRERPYVQEIDRDAGRLRIAYTSKAATGVEIHADCVDAVNEAVKLLTDLGHDVQEASPKVDGSEMSRAFMAIWTAGVANNLEQLGLMTGEEVDNDQLEPLTIALAEMGDQVSSARYLTALAYLQKLARTVGHFMTDYDVWLTPTLGEPPVPLGTFDPTPENPAAGFFRSAEFVPFTPIANVTGQPAMSVPLYWNQRGLPIGTHFVGRFGDEATLFRLAAQLEQAHPWAARWPALVE